MFFMDGSMSLTFLLLRLLAFGLDSVFSSPMPYMTGQDRTYLHEQLLVRSLSEGCSKTVQYFFTVIRCITRLPLKEVPSYCINAYTYTHIPYPIENEMSVGHPQTTVFPR